MLFSNNSLWKPLWSRRFDQAHSPLHLAQHDTKELRSQLFPERRRIPSRKGKYIITICFAMQVWGCYHMSTVKRHFSRKAQEKQKLERKATPFFQAIDDIKYCSLTEKKDILMRELFTPDYYNQVKDRFHQKDIWVPFEQRSPHMYNRTSKNTKPYGQSIIQRYVHGLDLYNI